MDTKANGEAKSGAKSRGGWRMVVAGALALMLGAAGLAGCATMEPQAVAMQQAPVYYSEPYSQLSAEQKMQLENHLANQSNQAWRTTASVAGSLGRLAEGTGVLLFAAKR